VITAALHALPCEFADISPTDWIGAGQAAGEGSIMRMGSVSCTGGRLGCILGWEETRAHPCQGMEEDMAAVSRRVDLGAVVLFLFMRNDKRSCCQFASVDIGLEDLVRVSV
jgi:hypothetical protein